jgi:site-specific recombinase XerD
MVTRTTISTPSAPNFSAHLIGVDGFVLHLRALGRAEKTIDTYVYSLEALAPFCGGRGMPAVASLSTEHLREFFNELFERGNKPAGVSVRYRALQQYYKWLALEGERSDNPLDRIPAPRVPETLQRPSNW